MTEVVAALIRRDGRMLICKRPEGKKRAGRWEFPGGKPEAGETPQEALERECREELDVSIDVGELISEVRHTYPDMEVTLRLYEARIEGRQDPRMLEHADMRWVTAAELGDFEFCDADESIIRMLQDEAGAR